MRTIVVGLDTSASGLAALAWAAERARDGEATVRAVSVVERPMIGARAAAPVAEGRARGAEEVNPAVLARLKAAFASVGPGPGWELQVVRGHPGRVLVEAAASADLLVLGVRAHTGLTRLVLGSTAHYCLSHAPCPLATVPVRRTGTAAESRREADLGAVPHP